MHEENFARGAWLMLGSALFFSLMAILIRIAAEQLHPFEIAFFRNLFGLAFALPLLLRLSPQGLRTSRFKLYLVRCVVGLAAMLSGFWALVHLPLSQAIALNYTVPLFVTIGAALVLGEVVRMRRWTAVAIGFLGVLVIVRTLGQAFSPAMMVAIFSAACAASAALSIKILSRTESTEAIVVWMVMIMTPLSLLPALPYWEWPTAANWGWLVLIGFCGTAGHVCLTRAFQHADASALMPFEFVKLPMVAAMAWVLFSERMDMWTAIGAGVIFASTFYIARREVLLARRQVTDPLVAVDASQTGTGTLPVKPDER